MIELSIILPAYNDAPALALFLPELYEFLGEQDGCHEIIVVDDGSRDDIDKVCYEQVPTLAKYPTPSSLNNLKNLPKINLRLIRLSRNFGKEAALSAGLAHAQGQVVAMMDSDGQHPIAILKQMLEHYRHGVDMVAAVQENREHESTLAQTLKQGFYRFMQDGGRYELKPNAGDFRLMSRAVVNALLSLPERQRFMKGLYAWVGFKTVYVPFSPPARLTGESKFNYGGLFALAVTGITSFSLKPLRWISRMGFIVSALSILYGLYIVADTLIFGNAVAGWATVAAGIMFSAGVQLICLGVIGEYIGRIYEEVKQRPLYLIKEEWHSTQSHL